MKNIPPGEKTLTINIPSYINIRSFKIQFIICFREIIL